MPLPPQTDTRRRLTCNVNHDGDDKRRDTSKGGQGASSIVAILAKGLVNKVAARFIFLNRKSKVLAVENFRAFNVFTRAARIKRLEVI